MSAQDLMQVRVPPVSLTTMVCPHVTTVLLDTLVEDVNFAPMVTTDKRYNECASMQSLKPDVLLMYYCMIYSTGAVC